MKKLLLFLILGLSFGVKAQTIQSVNPNAGTSGQTLQVTITGNNTNFSEISGTGVGFYGNSASLLVNSINIVSDTEVIADVTVPYFAPTGSYAVSIWLTDGMNYYLGNGFSVTNTANTITGNIGIDANGDGCDASDMHMAGIKVKLNDGTNDSYTYTNAAGDYLFYAQAGSYTITPMPEMPFFLLSPLSATVDFATQNNLTETRNFCLVPDGVHNDIEVSIFPLTVARPGFDATYRIVYKNKGNQTIPSGTINFTFDDSRIDLISVTTPPTSQATNSMSWDYVNLLPFQTRIIDLVFNVNSPMETPAVNIGDLLDFEVTTNALPDEVIVEDNTHHLTQSVVGSYDPNDKAVVEGSQIDISKIDDYLHYVIRFQNSGNFAAENVVVKDMLSPNLDLSTLEVVSASHPYRSSLTEENKLEFFFENINLPSENVNEPGSHGFIAFKIKPAGSVVVGSVIENTADIYFDFNFPIVTNTVSTTVTTLGNPSFGTNGTIQVYPNPVKGIANIKATEAISKIRVVNISGQMLLETQPNATDCTIDISAFPKGIYFVTAESGGKLQRLKIIKE